MLAMGQKKLKVYDNITWYKASAERLPFKDDTFDFYKLNITFFEYNHEYINTE